VILAARVQLPERTKALLFDLDGVIVDSLTLEYEVVNELLGRHGIAPMDREVVRVNFPFPIPESWGRILNAAGHEPDDALVAELTEELEAERARRTLPVHVGIAELLAGGLPVAVVSNNPRANIEDLLRKAGISANAIVGNDQDGIRSKPAPDPYLAGARAMGAEPAETAAFEDSLLGARSAREAGCFVVGVATGAATFDELEASPDVDVVYESFSEPEIRLEPGDVRRKALHTPNEFVTHMLEHVAWRLGCSAEIRWHSDDWHALGRAVGSAIEPLLDGPDEAQALGMIDDGSAEVRATRAPEPRVELSGAGVDVDVDWFTGLRVEQLATGMPLVEMLDGLAEGTGTSFTIEVASLEDPHHTWEAIWRGVGVALRGLSSTLAEPDVQIEPGPAAGGIEVLDADFESASVRRVTAESVCKVAVSLVDSSIETRIETSPSVQSQGLAQLVEVFARRAGLGIRTDFAATRLSSSHVAAEDVGMTIGAALAALASERMATTGIEGAGSSLNGAPAPIRVGVSFEGRKFVRFQPVGWSQDELRRTIIGQTLANGLFSEDLDDFVDGFAGGMGCSVIVHWERITDPDEAWRLIFGGLGAAIAQLLTTNRSRRGVIAGVKGTLA
jgi:HAD superfamily hydrolase (TIGR01509 family)